MKRMTYFVMALALVLGFTQCKKEQVNTPENETKTVNITLNVGGNGGGSRHDINTTTGAVDFQDDDVIYVGDGSTYIGTLTRTGGVFTGDINEPADGTEIYFFFVGGLPTTPADLSGQSSFTVDISDQSNKMPVLSCNHVTYSSSTTSYSCVLQNQCALVKFTTASGTDGPVHVGGLYTEAQIDFASKTIAHTDTKGFVNLYPDAVDNTAKWAVLLPQTGFEYAEAAIAHVGYTATIPTIAADGFITGDAAVSISTTNNNVYLDWLTSDYTATDGQTLNGTLNGNYQVSIADGATVSLNGANININNYSKSGSLNCAGITCLGNATINLYGGSINHCSSNNYPGIQAGPQGKTLTIQGTGSLNVQGGSNAAGIGGGSGITCGNISLKGGAITACGGQYGAGIGSGQGGTCGNIEIVGGEITATGGEGAAGIGSGSGINTVCGNIYLYGGIINACGSDGAAGIGSGSGGTCGSIEIEGGTITAEGGSHAAGIGSGQNGSCGNIEVQGGEVSATGNGGGSDIGAGYGGNCGDVTLPLPEESLSGLFSVSSSKQVRFSRGNLQSDGTFAVNQYTYGDFFSASNSYDGPAGWDALTTDEWNYLYQHSTFGFATVNGIHGLIILPNNYTGSSITAYNPQDGSRILWNDNTYLGDAWTAMENNGVVFLPAAGYYKTSFPGMGLNNQGDEGCYLSSSGSVYFRFVNKKEDIYVGGTDPWSTSINPNESGNTREQYSVRLVKTEETN